jgi:hypothetical protein
MYNYPKDLLSDGEEVVVQLRPHFRALLLPGLVLLASIIVLSLGAFKFHDTFMAAPLIIAAIIIAIFGTLIPFMRWLTTQYVFTNRRIITRLGLITRSGRDMPLSKVNNVTFFVTFLGRLLNYGDLKIDSAAERDGDLIIKDVPNVEKMQRLIYDLYDADDERRRGGASSPERNLPAE